MKEKTETQTEKLRQEKRTLRWMPRVQKEDTQKWGGGGEKDKRKGRPEGV
jgi:hypothetical protein